MVHRDNITPEGLNSAKQPGSKRVFWVFVLLFLLALGGSSKAKDFEAGASVPPSESDNFYQASCRLWASEQTRDVRGILVLLQGTDSDGRFLADRKRWQELARNAHLALLGCNFRGEGEPYEQAGLGSGKALLAIIEQISKATGIPRLNRVPLYFVGHSSGAMFAYNFACWNPERTGAFVAVKSGPIPVSADPRVTQVPGLFIVGENDMDERVQSAAKAFAWQRRAPGHWAIALEQNKGHEWTPAIDRLVNAYIGDVVRLSNRRKAGAFPGIPSGEGFIRSFLSPLEPRIAESPQDDLVWLPGKASLEEWQKFTVGGSVDRLVAKTTELRRSEIEVSPISLDLGTAPLPKPDSPTLKSSAVVSLLGNELTQCSFSSSDPRLSVTSKQEAPDRYWLALNLNLDGLPAGPYRSAVQLSARRDGSGFQQITIPVFLRVASAYLVSPPSIYVGVLSRGQILEKTVTVASRDGSRVKLSQIKSSNPEFVQIRPLDDRAAAAGFKCRFDGSKALGNQSGYIELELDNWKAQKIRIPFVAFVSKKAQSEPSAER